MCEGSPQVLELCLVLINQISRLSSAHRKQRPDASTLFRSYVISWFLTPIGNLWFESIFLLMIASEVCGASMEQVVY